MKEFAEREFALSAVDKDGISLRESLQGLLERTKKQERIREYSEQLALPPFPKALRYLWEAYLRIRRRKGASGFGLSPIEWPDIDAFQRLAGLALVPWEVETIEALDDVFLMVHRQGADTASETGTASADSR